MLVLLLLMLGWGGVGVVAVDAGVGRCCAVAVDAGVGRCWCCCC